MILPAALARYPELSHGAKLMWAALNNYSDLPEIYPATETMGQQIGVGLRMAQRYLDELEAQAFIFVDRTHLHFSKKGGGGTPTYWFLWHDIFNPTHDTSITPVYPGSHDTFVTSAAPGHDAASQPPLTDVSCPPLTDVSPPTHDTSVTQTGISKTGKKEQVSPLSVLDTSLRKENDDKPITRFASPKNGDGLPGASSCLTANPDENHSAAGMAAKLAASEKAFLRGDIPAAKPWTQRELKMIRDHSLAYMENDTPPYNFAGNCELAADGHSAKEVIAYFDSKYAKKKYRPGGTAGPRSWTWFYSVIAREFGRERGHLPEAPAVQGKRAPREAGHE
jgi:hypothetical protein